MIGDHTVPKCYSTTQKKKREDKGTEKKGEEKRRGEKRKRRWIYRLFVVLAMGVRSVIFFAVFMRFYSGD